MNEFNQKMAENLGLLLLGFKEEVIQGLQDYMSITSNNLNTETI